MKLLVVEDDTLFAPSLIGFLEDSYTVEWARTLREATDFLALSPYDCVLLDLHLPDGEGEELCAIIRAQNNYTPLLILTGDFNIETKVRTLLLGADDYITKPFQGGELLARIHALLRRGRSYLPTVLQVGQLEIDTVHKQVHCNGKQLILSRKEYDILLVLARNADSLVSASTLIEYVWDNAHQPFSNVLEVHLHSLRKKLKEAGHFNLLETIRGFGYTLHTPVEHRLVP